MSIQKKIVVVGAGIVGLMAALRLTKVGHKVTLLEQDAVVGGGFRSDLYGTHWFDRGIHIPAATGLETIDALLFGESGHRGNDFHAFHHLELGSFFNGKLTRGSPLVNLHSLGANYKATVDGLLGAPGASSSTTNAIRFSEENFGLALTNNVVRPALTHLYGEHVMSLHKMVLDALHLRRFIALTPAETLKLKAQPEFDDRLGFHRGSDGPMPPSPRYFYPRGSQGVGSFADNLHHQIEAANGVVRLRCPVTAIDHSGKKVHSLRVGDSTDLRADHFVWALPAAMLVNLANTGPRSSAPAYRRQWLYHFVFDHSEQASPLHYITSHDPAYRAFRILFYENLQQPIHDVSNGWRITVEVWLNPNEVEPSTQEIAGELLAMGIVTSNNLIRHAPNPVRGLAVPVLTQQFFEKNAHLRTELKGQLENIDLVGQGSANAFFLTDLLRDVELTLQPLLDRKVELREASNFN